MKKKRSSHKIKSLNIWRLILSATGMGLLVSVFVNLLKKLTEHTEEWMLHTANAHAWMLMLLPLIGISIIRISRKAVFKNKPNKGIKEVYHTLSHRKNELPAYKIPSHYLNGFLTVISGGSTGIEVSTVVSSAALGATAHKHNMSAKSHKTAMICAGVAAGITSLFVNPIAGILFSLEVIARKMSTPLLISTIVASVVAYMFTLCIPGGHLFRFTIDGWHYSAAPWAIILSICTGILAVYFTRLVIFTKNFYSTTINPSSRWITGALVLGLLIIFFPQLYGDSYHSIPGMIQLVQKQTFSINIMILLATFIVIKPLAASLTLGIGGDGGVFAPSIVAGATLGLLISAAANHFFHADLIIPNFMLLGAATMLSAAIFAPLTAVALVCGLAPGAYLLILPVLIGCYLSKYTARRICSYNVYTYVPSHNTRSAH